MMRFLVTLSIFLGIGFSSCKEIKEVQDACNSSNPLEDIAWLKEIKRTFDMDMGPQRQQIIQYRYKGMDVFVIVHCYQCPDALTAVYDCEKNVVCEFGGIDGRNTCPDFEENASNRIVLYDN